MTPMGKGAKFVVEEMPQAGMIRCKFMNSETDEERIIACCFPETMSKDDFHWLLAAAASFHKINLEWENI
jgi:hypothetical protein